MSDALQRPAGDFAEWCKARIVLFVDDEPSILRSIERIVIREPYRKLFCGSATEALAVLEQEPVAVIVSDMRMPVMDGLTFLRHVREKFPGRVRLVLSGYAQVAQVLAAVNTGEVFRFLMKPVDDPEAYRETLWLALHEAFRREGDEALRRSVADWGRELERVAGDVGRAAQELCRTELTPDLKDRLADALTQDMADLQRLADGTGGKETP